MENINFELELEKFISCVKCRIVVTDPQESNCCGTLYCHECSRLLTTCLNCKTDCKFRENSFIKRILNQMLIKCSFNCGCRFSYQEIKNHMQSCELRVYNCNICINKGTSFSSNKKELLSHLIETHEDELIDINDKYSVIKKKQEKNYSLSPATRFEKDYLNYDIDEHYRYNPIDEFSYNDEAFDNYDI